MSQNYAFFSTDQGFELLETLDVARDSQIPQERFFALSPDSTLAKTPAQSKVREALQRKDRPEKRAYFTEESEAREGRKAERLLARSHTLQSKLFERKGERKS